MAFNAFTVVIARPAPLVEAFLLQPQRRRYWTGRGAGTVSPDGPPTVGTTIDEADPTGAAVRTHVTAYEPGRAIELVEAAPDAERSLTFMLRSAEGQTALDVLVESRPRGWLGRLNPLYRRRERARLARHWEALRTAVEGA